MRSPLAKALVIPIMIFPAAALVFLGHLLCSAIGTDCGCPYCDYQSDNAQEELVTTAVVAVPAEENPKPH